MDYLRTMEEQSTGGIRILHVEPDTDIAELTARFLEDEDESITVFTESTAEDSLSRLVDNDIDCIVADYALPGMDGLEFLRIVREVSSDIPFILFTGRGSEDVANAAISAGVTDYIQKDPGNKPFQMLTTRINDILAPHDGHADYREIFEKVPDGILLHDSQDGTILDVNQQFAEMQGYSRKELLGMGFGEIHIDEPPFTLERAEELVEKAASSGPQTFEWVNKTKDGERLPVEVHLRQTFIGGEKRVLAVVRDITERKEQETELERERERLRVLFENAPTPIMYGVLEDGEPIIKDLNPAFESVFGLDVDEVEGTLLDDHIVPEDADSEELNRRIVTEGTVQAEVRREAADGIRDFQLQTAVVPLEESENGWSDEGWAIYTDITEQKERERHLQRQREELESLTQVNTLIDDIVQALVSASTRDEIEDIVCRRLADSEIYTNALIVERDDNGHGIAARTSAGLEAEYVQSIADLSTEEVADSGLDRVLRGGEMTVTTQTTDAVVSPDAIRGLALSHGYQSVAIVPLRYGSTVYGALVVNDPRDTAFDGHEEHAFKVLGEVVGFAINAINNRKTLLSDTALELEFEVTDENSIFVAASEQLSCSFTVEGIVPREGQSLLCYLTVEGATADAVLDAIADEPNVTDPRIVCKDGDRCSFECTLSGSSAVLALSEYGATVRSARVDSGTGTLVGHLAPNADVRNVVATFQDAFPDSRLVGKRTVELSTQTGVDTHEEILDRLTEKQWRTLQAAYFSGYFDSPRGTTAQELANTLGIASSTLHQHLQAALRKTLGVVLE
jgi:PAS domain S-box-containing protein